MKKLLMLDTTYKFIIYQPQKRTEVRLPIGGLLFSRDKKPIILNNVKLWNNNSPTSYTVLKE